MTRIRTGQQLLPSLLDRLLDDEPENQREAPSSRTQQLKQLKQSVRRDLEHLLNARVCLREVPAELNEVRTSVLNYGIPDFGGLLLSSADSKESLRRRVEDVVRRYETRFKQVRVELVLENDQKSFRTIRLRIDGVLHAEPAPEPVTFDSHIIPSVGEFRVQASDG
jgi:type VI secretion system protein ImpF